jgi:hypothetical protein
MNFAAKLSIGVVAWLAVGLVMSTAASRSARLSKDEQVRVTAMSHPKILFWVVMLVWPMLLPGLRFTRRKDGKWWKIFSDDDDADAV